MFCWMFLRPNSSSRNYFYFFLITCGTISPQPPRMLIPLDWKMVSMLALTAFGRSPPPPLTHLTDLPKISEKRGLIQKSFKWAQNHERTMSGSIAKATRHFLESIFKTLSRRNTNICTTWVLAWASIVGIRCTFWQPLSQKNMSGKNVHC